MELQKGLRLKGDFVAPFHVSNFWNGLIDKILEARGCHRANRFSRDVAAASEFGKKRVAFERVDRGAAGVRESDHDGVSLDGKPNQSARRKQSKPSTITRIPWAVSEPDHFGFDRSSLALLH